MPQLDLQFRHGWKGANLKVVTQKHRERVANHERAEPEKKLFSVLIQHDRPLGWGGSPCHHS